jgi:hypothetical protein
MVQAGPSISNLDHHCLISPPSQQQHPTIFIIIIIMPPSGIKSFLSLRSPACAPIKAAAAAAAAMLSL